MDKQSKMIILTIVLALLGGILVICLNKNFRIDKILLSNKNYFPMVKIAGKEK